MSEPPPMYDSERDYGRGDKPKRAASPAESPQDDLAEVSAQARGRAVANINAYNAPWWFLILVLMWLWVIAQMQSNPDYGDAFAQLREGISLTLFLAFASYFFAIIIGLLTGLLRANPPKKPDVASKKPFSKRAIERGIWRVVHVVVYNLVSVYIEFMRGIPPLVFLLIAGFIIVPAIREPFQDVYNVLILPFHNGVVLPFINNFRAEPFEPASELLWRGRAPATAIAGLSLIYGAFLSEVFRAGIQAVPQGQVEAAKSLGMTYFQTMRFVVIPQAVRNVLPPLGNNFISMIKDTSLVTVLGTSEITQIARRWTGSQFTYIETYAVLSMIYLTLTVTGSLLVQLMERRLRRFSR